jgi:hypothetical protein
MATRNFFIIDNLHNTSDGVIKNPDKEEIGLAWQHEAPVGYYIKGVLKGYWIITDKEKKLLDKIKKDE